MADFRDYPRNPECFWTTPTVAGGAGAVPAVLNGNIIQDDMVRYIWKIRARNANVAAARTLTVYAGDVANTKRRVIFITTIAPGGVLDWPAHPQPDGPALRVAPNTATTPTQENGIYFADDSVAGGDVVEVSYTYFDKRN